MKLTKRQRAERASPKGATKYARAQRKKARRARELDERSRANWAWFKENRDRLTVERRGRTPEMDALMAHIHGNPAFSLENVARAVNAKRNPS